MQHTNTQFNYRKYDTQHNDNQQNDNKYNNTQLNNTNVTPSTTLRLFDAINTIMLCVIMLSVIKMGAVVPKNVYVIGVRVSERVRERESERGERE